jgi:hypothetical protein
MKQKKANSPLQPAYPCFGQDLGDSEGAGNLPTQRCGILLFFQNLHRNFGESFSSTIHKNSKI